jgi:pimeloyl-ACP methyl ester carboxylesterase
MGHWIFLRGLTRESRHWGDFIEKFQHALPMQTVVPLDLAGNGPLNQQSSRARVQDMVEDCRAQLALRHIAPPYHLLAMSLGAMVSVAWAQIHPKEVAAQVLINTSMRPFSPFYRRLRPANYTTLLKLMLPGNPPEDWEREVLAMTSNLHDGTVLPYWQALRLQNPVSRGNALRQLLAAARFCASSRPPKSPTLLLASEHDHLVSVACSRAVAHAWQCTLQIHPGAGHDIPLDDGPWVAQQVQNWLDTVIKPSKP